MHRDVVLPSVPSLHQKFALINLLQLIVSLMNSFQDVADLLVCVCLIESLYFPVTVKISF